MPVRVLLADDHAIVREGLRMILGGHRDLEVVGEAATGLEAVREARTLRADVVIMDIAMPSLNGIEATRMIRERAAAPSVVILSMHHTREHVFRSGVGVYESAGPTASGREQHRPHLAERCLDNRMALCRQLRCVDGE